MNNIDTDRIDDFNIYFAPTVETAQALKPDITIEAVYGNVCVEGKELTLDHHGDRSDNPAPCNTDVPEFKQGTIVIYGLDLDTVGGILAVAGQKPDDPEFWSAAEKIDVNGPHHLHEFSQDIQDKFNAIYAYNQENKGQRLTEPTRIEPAVKSYCKMLNKVLDKDNPEHEQMIEKGRQWAKAITHQTESRCVFENKNVRGFITDGPFCNSSYYSPKQQEIVPAIVSYNTKFKAISISFADGGKTISAEHTAKELFGPGAGGHAGIAGSPRGQEMTREDFDKALNCVQDKIIERNQEIEPPKVDKDKDAPSL